MEEWGVVIASLVPLGAVILFVIKSFQINMIDAVFMKKERKTAMYIVQCILTGGISGFYNCVLINFKLRISCSIDSLLFLFVIYALLFLAILAIYAKVIFYHHISKNKKRLSTTVFDRYCMISFVMLVVLSGVILLACVDMYDENDIYFGIVMFTLMKILYLMLSVRISEILSDKKVWVKYKRYSKLYLLYEFDKETILCKIPQTEGESGKQYIRIPKKELENRPLHEELNGK